MDEDLVLKILGISYFYPPSETPRAIQVHRYVKNSENKFILFTNNGGQQVKKIGRLKSTNVVTEFVQDSKIENRFLKKILDHLMVPDNKLFWNLRVIRRILFLLKKDSFDCIFSFCQPLSSAFTGLFFKIKLKKPWVLHLSDPWAYNEYIKFWQIKFILNKIFECLAFYFADKIIFTSNECKKFYTKKYFCYRKKFFFIPHSYEKMYKKNKVNLQSNNKIIIRYLGSFYGKRNPNDFLKKIANINLNFSKKLFFEFYGSYNQARYCFKNSLSNILFFRNVPYKKSITLINSANGLVCLDGRVRHPIYLPSKLIDYVGSGKPIFALSDSPEIKSIVKKTKGFFSSFQNFSKNQQSFHNFLYKCQHKKSIKINKNILKKYDPKENAKKIDKIISSAF